MGVIFILFWILIISITLLNIAILVRVNLILNNQEKAFYIPTDKLVKLMRLKRLGVLYDYELKYILDQLDKQVDQDNYEKDKEILLHLKEKGVLSSEEYKNKLRYLQYVYNKDD